VLTNTNKTMANKFLNWIDKKGVPIMGFVVMTLLAVLAAVTIYRMIFTYTA
jgi:amino acid permease